jgi:2'-5' RNA ligase
VARPAPSLRLFVAIYPPPERQREYLGAARALRPPPAPDHRETPPEQVHLTLQFVGHVPERELPGILESVERSASGVPAFSMAPTRLISLPERGTPRLLAMEFDAPGPLLEVRRRLVKRLAREPRRENPERFLPHMTVLRYSGYTRARRIEEAVAVPAFEVREIVLVRSVLRPGGAVHSEVGRARLA